MRMADPLDYFLSTRDFRYALIAVASICVVLFWLFDHMLWFVTLYCHRVAETRDDDDQLLASAACKIFLSRVQLVFL